MNITVVGAGAWGTTLAALASERGSVTLWAREPVVVNSIRQDHENPLFLPRFRLPTQLHVTLDLKEALSGADIVVVAVPSPHVGAVLAVARESIALDAIVVSVTKGIEARTGRRMTEVIADALVDHDRDAIGVLAGPNLAREVMAGHPSATCVAFNDLRYAAEVQQLFTSERFRVDISTDVVGCEISGAVKNVIAIAAGLADGLDYGMNTKAALVTRGLAELARLGTTLGGDPPTFLGLAGAGDLIATCASPSSRNRQVGERIAKGWVLAEIESTTDVSLEGVNSVETILRMAGRHDVELPVCEMVAAVLAGTSTPQDAVAHLIGRPATTPQAAADEHRS